MIHISSLLNQFPELLHGFTDRFFGFDYQAIENEVGLSPIVTLRQIHSDKVKIIKSPFHPPLLKGKRGGFEAEEGDALVTQQEGILIGIRTADCVPLLVFDPATNTLAAIHAGWRGLVGGVIENTFETMKEKFEVDPKDCVVAIGASLCEACFEVGPEVLEAFKSKFGNNLKLKKNKKGKGYVDLRRSCVLVLKAGGVPLAHVEVLPFCTS